MLDIAVFFNCGVKDGRDVGKESGDLGGELNRLFMIVWYIDYRHSREAVKRTGMPQRKDVTSQVDVNGLSLYLIAIIYNI